MRKAAGIMLIILGMWGLIGLIGGIIVMSDSGMNPYLPFFLWRIICIPFFVIGGVFCIRKKILESMLGFGLACSFHWHCYSSGAVSGGKTFLYGLANLDASPWRAHLNNIHFSHEKGVERDFGFSGW
jgi:hypothetical protein